MNKMNSDSKLTMHPHVSQNKYIDSHSQTVTNMLERKLKEYMQEFAKLLVPNRFPSDIQGLPS